MIDYQAMLYDPIYSALGVPATIIPTNGERISVTAIDKTAGDTKTNGAVIEMQSLTPAARVRMSEITSNQINVNDELYEGQLEIAGKTWRIKSHQRVPAPTGPDEGEIILFLSDEAS